MTEILATTEIPRERGYIYYVGTDDRGNLTLCKTKAGRHRKKPKEDEKI